MSSANECFHSIQNSNSSLNYNKKSCDVDVSKRYSLWFLPSNAITVNVNADINISNSLEDYAIKWWETSSQFSNEFNNNAIIDIFYSSGNYAQSAIWIDKQRINILTNSGTIRSRKSWTDSTALYNYFGTIDTLNNTTTGILGYANIEPTGATTYTAIRNYQGYIGTINNDGAIYTISNEFYSTISKIYNTNTGSLNNNNTKTDGGAIANYATATIGSIINEGYIRGKVGQGKSHGIRNQSKISLIENLGKIESYSSTSFDISNVNDGSIGTLINSQGFATSDPLTLTGNLPTNYYVHIDSTTDYGQLSVTSGSGNINFGITEGSVIGVPTANYTTYSSAATLNPAASTPYKIGATGKDITVIADNDWTVSGPVHNILVEQAENFNLTINAGITAKNEKGSIAGVTYSSVLAGVSASQIASETTKTVELDGTDVTFTLAETSTSGTWDLSTNAVSDQSGQVVHIDNTSINDVTITNNGTIWSTENNAIEMDGTDNYRNSDHHQHIYRNNPK